VPQKSVIEWGNIKSNNAFYKTFLIQSGAPNGHGKNLDAVKEALIKSHYFKLAKTADIFHENRRDRMTITTHFVN